MLPVVRTLGLRYLWEQRARSFLIIASIALGVATLVSTQLLMRCLEAAADTNNPASGVADLHIHNLRAGVPQELVADVRDIPGVASAQPLIFDWVAIPDLDIQDGVFFGIDLESASGSADNYGIQVTWNYLNLALTDLPRVVISRTIADRLEEAGQRPSDPFTIRVAGAAQQVRPVGMVDLTGAGAKLGRYVLATDLETAAVIEGTPGKVTRIDVIYDGTVDPVQVEAAVREVAGAKAQVRTPGELQQSTQEMIGGVRAGFAICAAGAMVVGLFLVYNALSVSVVERRHDIGVLRSLGATRFQIARLFAYESLVLGLGGALIGLPLGSGLASFAMSLISDELNAVFVSGSPTEVSLDLSLAVAAVAAGALTALFAALIPALRAATDEPADAVRRVPSASRGWSRLAHHLTCLILVGGGAALVIFRAELPPRFGSYFGLVMILVGLLLSMPILVGGAARLLRPVIRWCFGLEARLAADNLSRAPGRTGLVIGAFGAGVALMIQIAGVGRSNQEPVMDWLDRVVKAEMFMFAGDFVSASSSNSPMRPELGQELLEAIPEVERVAGIRYHPPIEFGNTRILVVGIDVKEYVEETQKRSPDQHAQLQAFLDGLTGENNAFVSENFAHKHNVQPGDTITLPVNPPVRLRIQGTGVDYTWSQGTIFLDRAEYARLFDDHLIDLYHVYLKDPSPEAREAVRRFAAERDLVAEDYPAVRAYIGGLIDRVFQLAYLQQVVVAVVASLGIVMAVMISVLQRRRELGLLRAVGATRPQVMRSILAEALLMGLLGTFLGILIGLPLEWYILRVVLYEESGFIFEVLFPWWETLGIVGGALGVACLAGLLPALSAMRLRITEAISYE